MQPELDATLLVVAAHVLLDAGRESDAAKLAGWAVEEMPGNKQLLAWEASVAAGEQPTKIDLTALMLGTEPGAGSPSSPKAGREIDADAVPPLQR